MDKKMQICMVGSSFQVRGGMTSVCRQLSSHNFGEDLLIRYIPTHEFGSIPHRCLVFVQGYLRLLWLLLWGRVDLMHIHMSERGSFYRKYLIHRMVKFFRKPDVLHMHGSEFQEFYKNTRPWVQRRVRRFLGEADRVIVLGERWDEIVHAIAPEAKTMVIHNAVPIPPETAVWDDTETRLCYVGVLTRRKGVSDLMEAMAILAARPDLPRPVKLTIAGSGPAEEELVELRKKLHLESVVKFVGWTENGKKGELLRSSQCFILPSYNEGLPVAVLEAISQGLPVICTNVGSTDEAVIHGENGYFVPLHAPRALADAMFLTIANRQQWERLSRRAREIATARFDEEILFSKMAELYRTLTGGENP